MLLKKLLYAKAILAVSSLTLDEYEYATFRLSEGSKAEVIKTLKINLRKLFKLSNLILINPPLEAKKHLRVLNLVNRFNLKPRDAYHLFTMRENKVKFMATFDSDFDKIFKSGFIKRFE